MTGRLDRAPEFVPQNVVVGTFGPAVGAAINRGEIAAYVLGPRWRRVKLAAVREWAHRAGLDVSEIPNEWNSPRPRPVAIIGARLGCGAALRRAVTRGEVRIDARGHVLMADARAWIERHRVEVRG